MAARTRRLTQTEETRTKIQVAQIINRLHAHMMGEVTMDSAQVSSAKTLLAKALPDLQAVQISGDEANPLTISVIERKIVPKPVD